MKYRTVKDQYDFVKGGKIIKFPYGSEGVLLRHKITGEIMVLLGSGDGYGNSDYANAHRLNIVTGSYEEVRFPKSVFEVVEPVEQ